MELGQSNSDKSLALAMNSSVVNRSWEEFTSPSAIIEDPETKYHPAKDIYEKLPKLKELFTIHGKVGEGTFSSVYVATLNASANKEQKTLFAVKYLVPTCHPSRVERELKCLKMIGGGDNVIGVDLCLRIHDNIAFIMPFLHHQKFTEYFTDMDPPEAALYIKNLLIALKRVHSFNVVHRDVKPSNFLYDRPNKRFLLVDFGLAQELKDTKSSETGNKRKLTEEDAKLQPNAKRIALASKYAVSPGKSATFINTGFNKENDPSQSNLQLKSPFKSPFKNYNCLSPNVSQKVNKKSPLKRSPYKNQIDSINKSIAKLPQMPTSHIRKLSFDDEAHVAPMTSFIYPSERNFTQARNIQRSGKLRPKQIEKGSTKLKNDEKLKQCQCYRKPKICNACMKKKPQHAPRAGTPGFRPPEVLLKSTKQNTSVDIWAVGIIFISILSGCYPFFKASDDLSALAEMITLFGTNKFENLARSLGLNLTCSERRKPIDLKKLCMALRQRIVLDCEFEVCRDCKSKKNAPCLCNLKTESFFPDAAYDLLHKLLDINPLSRISAEEALKHPFLCDM